MMVTNRDFVQLFLTIEFAPHADPLSSTHIDAILATLKEAGGDTAPEHNASSATDSGGNQRRSCINIQLPVQTPDCAEKTDFVRASYGSVEVLRELEGQGTEWW